MNDITHASIRGRMLYHAVWETTGAAFFDTNRLAQWSTWEHRFDEVIDGIDSALGYIDRLLASLKDNFTTRLTRQTDVVPATPSLVESADGSRSEDVFAGIGESNIGYLRIESFGRADIADLVEAGIRKIVGCDGVILDLRQNNGGRMQQAMECCGFFLSEGLLATLEFRHENGVKQRQFFVNEDQFYSVDVYPNGSESTPKKYKRRPPLLAGKPLVLIINGVTASASEVMTVALVQNGSEGMVHIVGSGVTPGKGIGQSDYEFLDGEVVIRISLSRWLAPGGDWLGDCGQTVKNGIEPYTMVEGDRGLECLQAAVTQLKKMLEEKST